MAVQFDELLVEARSAGERGDIGAVRAALQRPGLTPAQSSQLSRWLLRAASVEGDRQTALTALADAARFAQIDGEMISELALATWRSTSSVESVTEDLAVAVREHGRVPPPLGALRVIKGQSHSDARRLEAIAQGLFEASDDPESQLALLASRGDLDGALLILNGSAGDSLNAKAVRPAIQAARESGQVETVRAILTAIRRKNLFDFGNRAEAYRTLAETGDEELLLEFDQILRPRPGTKAQTIGWLVEAAASAHRAVGRTDLTIDLVAGMNATDAVNIATTVESPVVV